MGYHECGSVSALGISQHLIGNQSEKIIIIVLPSFWLEIDLEKIPYFVCFKVLNIINSILMRSRFIKLLNENKYKLSKNMNVNYICSYE